MATALHGAPVRGRPLNQVGDVRKWTRRGKGKPVPERLERAGLCSYVVREMRQRVPPLVSSLVVNILVAARERHGLKRDEADLLAIVCREPYDRSHLIVV